MNNTMFVVIVAAVMYLVLRVINGLVWPHGLVDSLTTFNGWQFMLSVGYGLFAVLAFRRPK